MNAVDQSRAQARVEARPLGAGAPTGARERLHGLARRLLWRVAPGYAQRRSRNGAVAVKLERLQEEFEHVRKRHDEQLERLEDLARELVLTAESLRREIAQHGQRDET
jgi:hypothetical protein